MNDKPAIQSPKWLRVVVYALVAWCTFWALFWGMALIALFAGVLPVGLYCAPSHSASAAYEVLVIGVILLIEVAGTFFVTRLVARKLRSRSTIVFAVLGIILLIVGWVLPMTFS